MIMIVVVRMVVMFMMWGDMVAMSVIIVFMVMMAGLMQIGCGVHSYNHTCATMQIEE